MIASFTRAVAQLPDPHFRAVLVKSLALTIGAFVLVNVAAYLLLSWFIPLEFTIFGWQVPFLDWLAQALGIGAFLIATFLLFPAVATLVIGLFLDEIASAVERRHYPQDPPGKSVDFAAGLALSVRFVVVVILLNFAVIPVYLIFFWFPPINIVVFYGLNGHLLSREYFELVGSRHLSPDEVRRTRQRERWRLFPSGVVTALLLTIPIVNLIAPLIATAAMVHMFKGLSAHNPG